MCRSCARRLVAVQSRTNAAKDSAFNILSPEVLRIICQSADTKELYFRRPGAKEMSRPHRSLISPWPQGQPGNWRKRNSAALLDYWMVWTTRPLSRYSSDLLPARSVIPSNLCKLKHHLDEIILFAIDIDKGGLIDAAGHATFVE